MKTGVILTVALAALAGSATAQKTEKTKELMREEVPVMIVQSVQKDFSNLPEKGTWRLIYIEDIRTTRRLTPEFYEFSCKKDGERVELFYKPDGTLDHSVGITAPTHSSQP
jgi:hypothetical protein